MKLGRAQDGYHVLSVVRFYLREGHSHGMPVSLAAKGAAGAIALLISFALLLFGRKADDASAPNG